MSKTIIVESKNGAENVRLSRLKTRESNLEEDKEVWKILATTPCSKLLPIQKLKKDKLVNDRNYATAMNVGSSISERIVAKYADQYNISSIEEVTRGMIKDMAAKYLAWPIEAQLLVCRDPSRQSIDEEVQKNTLEKYLPSATVDKPTNGDLTLSDGDIVDKSKSTSSARSIDFVVKSNGKEFNVFAKYSKTAGSGQMHQSNESEEFIQEAKKYIDKHKDGKYFIVLADGKEAESHINDFNKLAVGYPNIFAGNCEDVIDFIQKT
jgi:hypothetical protein